MLTRRTFAVLGALGAAAAQIGGAQAQTSGARRREVEALRRFAETTHPRGREAAGDADWRGRWDRLAADADGLEDGAYFVRTRRALGWFKDGHTTVLPFEFVGGVPAAFAGGAFALSLPIQVRAFHDGAYVIAAKEEAAPLLGARITRIGALRSEALIQAIAVEWPGNEAWTHRWAGWHFSSPALLQALGAVSDPAGVVEIEAVLGRRRVRARMRPRADGKDGLTPAPRQHAAHEAWAREAGCGNYARAEGDALYISCDDMSDVEGKSFEAFTRECFAAMDGPNGQRLILDLRRNGGGNNFLPEALRKRIGRSRFNRPGGLYILTSPATFSAAQNPATRLERDTFAIFAGEPTGGAPNHYGDAQAFTGEATGLVSIVSTLAWFDSYPRDRRPWIMPDLPAPALYEDWRSGRDAALEAALMHRTDAPADEWTRDGVFFYTRASQSQAWRPFWRA